MYSGGFYPFPDAETFWAWWSRHIYFNRYIDAPKQIAGQSICINGDTGEVLKELAEALKSSKTTVEKQ